MRILIVPSQAGLDVFQEEPVLSLLIVQQEPALAHIMLQITNATAPLYRVSRNDDQVVDPVKWHCLLFAGGSGLTVTRSVNGGCPRHCKHAEQDDEDCTHTTDDDDAVTACQIVCRHLQVCIAVPSRLWL